LVITSASKGLDASVVGTEPLNGAIFIGTPARGRGLPEARYGQGTKA
jgi:L-arabinonolactonase